jgi:hypothetical protein
MNKSEQPTESDKPIVGKPVGEKSVDKSIDDQLRDAMRSLLWIAPIDDATLSGDEAEYEQAKSTLDLPEKLQSADAIFAKLQQRTDAATPVSTDIGKQMARAAREGGKLTTDVEERMKRDREEAEHKHNKSKGYEDLFN